MAITLLCSSSCLKSVLDFCLESSANRRSAEWTRQTASSSATGEGASFPMSMIVPSTTWTGSIVVLRRTGEVPPDIR